MIVTVPMPEFAPDQTAHSPVLLRAENVLPAKDGYRSVGGISSVSDALTGTFLGAASAIADDGNAFLLAGTSTTLSKLASTGAWTTVVGSLSITGRWRFAQFNNYVICVNGSATRAVDLGTGTQATIAGAPTGTCVATIGDHVVIGQTDGVVNTLRWSAFNDHTGWTNAVDQAGEQAMTHGGAIMGIASGEYGVVLQRDRIVRMVRTGQALTPFYFDEISNNYGCAAGATFAQAGRSVFCYSDRGFIAIEDGQSIRPIGDEKVDRTFAAQVGRDALENIYTAVDPANKLVFWGSPGSPGYVWVYNFGFDRWATLSLPFVGIFPGYSSSMGIDDVSTLYGGGIDTFPYTFDDPRWAGGAPRLYFVNPDNEIGVLAGDKLPAALDMAFVEPTPGHRARVRRVRPVTDAIEGISIRLNSKARLGDAENVGLWNALQLSGQVPVRAAGRYIAPSALVTAGTTWDYIQALELECERGGRR